MNAPGQYALGIVPVTAAQIYEGDWITGLDGMAGVTAQIGMAYGSGSGSVVAYLQTSFDGGDTAVDIAAVSFGEVSKVAVLNLTGTTPQTTEITPTDGSLAADTAIDGLLGDRLRIKVVSSGTYAGNTLVTANVCAR